MNFKTISYSEYKVQSPVSGRHILAQQSPEHILVYQAFKPSIANYAVKNQIFGGTDYSYNRMSWIKPNFLWMMYRSGWATKIGQEKILGIWIKKIDFEKILSLSTFTSYKQSHYKTESAWKATLDSHPVRLQWDPDHAPNGDKLVRKAIQLGLKGEILEEFGKQMICEIIDLTEFVCEQRQFLTKPSYDELVVADEKIYTPNNTHLINSIGIDVIEEHHKMTTR